MRQRARMLPLDTAQPHRQKTADSDSHPHLVVVAQLEAKERDDPDDL
jgi:hypothetical protein